MKPEQEIFNRLEDLRKAEADLSQKIEIEFKTPIRTDGVMAKVSFFSTQRKQISAKIEELAWVLDQK